MTFEDELERLINKYSKENDSDTPDFILANFLDRCLEAFNICVSRRTDWYQERVQKYNLQMPIQENEKEP